MSERRSSGSGEDYIARGATSAKQSLRDYEISLVEHLVCAGS